MLFDVSYSDQWHLQLAADDDVGTPVCGAGIGAGSPVEDVFVSPAGKHVVTRPGHDDVFPASHGYRVIPGAGYSLVLAAPRLDRLVVASERCNDVVSVSRKDSALSAPQGYLILAAPCLNETREGNERGNGVVAASRVNSCSARGVYRDGV